MRELLEKAHQQDDDDLFKEEEGDEEFAAPGWSRRRLCMWYTDVQPRSGTYILTNSPIQTTKLKMKTQRNVRFGEKRNEKYALPSNIH
jgi:hypothetical protein